MPGGPLYRQQLPGAQVAKGGDEDHSTVVYAHSLEGVGPEGWQLNEDHLRNVSKLAEEFAGEFGAEEWGRLAGLWHDLGKYSREFQSYLRNANGVQAHLETIPGRVDHSTAGAQHAAQTFPGLAGQILAYIIAGHHAGLPDFGGGATEGHLSAILQDRLRREVPDWKSYAPKSLLEATEPRYPSLRGLTDARRKRQEIPFQCAFFVRMLFSCLIDADRLDTEGFVDREKVELRNREQPSLEALDSLLTNEIDRLSLFAAKSDVNLCRHEVLASCRTKASLSPGFFSLTVPTGGGKTLSSLQFALRHAIQHGLRRVIYVIPFTSIIEQTASVFRDVLGDAAVLEHHSNLDPERLEDHPRARLLCENWDAPVVVTTSVQFFESLFAAKTSRCRKLHNIARSVIIFDEAQTLSVAHLEPCLLALRELVGSYRCSIVLCTATQPALRRSENFAPGFDDPEVREITEGTEALYRRLTKRVQVQDKGSLSVEELVECLKSEQAALCIVNTRKHAAALFDVLRGAVDGGEAVFHLSALMCPLHRSQVLETIRLRLKENLPCRVVSTQVIEAGVDVDFPVVWRSITGIDSIAQAAGRCNREGKRASGDVFIFEPAEPEFHPRGLLRQVGEVAREILPDYEEDPLSLAAVRDYFEKHYERQKQGGGWDRKHVLTDQMMSYTKNGLLAQFRKIENAFQLIENGQVAIIVPWAANGQKLLEKLKVEKVPLDIRDWQLAQRLSVNVYSHELSRLAPAVRILRERFNVLIDTSHYDPERGLCVSGEGGVIDPFSLTL